MAVGTEMNPGKCKVMHIGHDCSTSYELILWHNGKPRVLEECYEERDLGACSYVTTDLKP